MSRPAADYGGSREWYEWGGRRPAPRRQPGRRPVPWWRRTGNAVRNAARRGGQHVQRLAAQGRHKAREAGQNLARHVIAVQRGAKLDEKIVEASARSVARRAPIRPSDERWRDGYLQVAAQRVPGIARELRPNDQLEAGQ